MREEFVRAVAERLWDGLRESIAYGAGEFVPDDRLVEHVQGMDDHEMLTLGEHLKGKITAEMDVLIARWDAVLNALRSSTSTPGPELR